MTFNQTTTEIIKLIAIIIVILLTRIALPIFKQFVEDYKLDGVYNIMDTLVRSAELYFKGSGRGEEKKKWVILKTKEYLSKKGINLTEDDISDILEAAVYDMKN